MINTVFSRACMCPFAATERLESRLHYPRLPGKSRSSVREVCAPQDFNERSRGRARRYLSLHAFERKVCGNKDNTTSSRKSFSLVLLTTGSD